MAQSLVNSDLYVNGALTARSFTPPTSSISNASVIAAAGINATKLEHQYERIYAQEAATNATTETRVIHAVYGVTGTLIAFRAGSVVAAAGAGTATIDLKKNGTTVLTGVITLSVAHVAYQLVAGSFASVSLVAGDVLSITITAGAATLPKGVFCHCVFREDPV